MAIRREVRLRKEFLFKCQQTAQAAAKSNKKRLLQEAIDGGMTTPSTCKLDIRLQALF